MSAGLQSKVSNEDLGRIMGICRFLNLSFTEEQLLAIIEVIEAGANPSALVDWLAIVEETKSEETPALKSHER
ncbi:hypothetical protein V3C99_002510 [Haemonchus contortus]